MNIQNLREKFYKTWLGFKQNLPIIIGVLLLMSMVRYSPVFSYLEKLDNDLFSTLVADFLGSIAAGNPINGWIIVSQIEDWQSKLIPITAFLVARITVGFLQIPAEVYFFGKKFAFLRNLISFLFAILAGLIVYLLMK